MKKIIIFSLLTLTSFKLYSQDSTDSKVLKWLENNKISIRKTFDGSKNENKPAALLFRENHKSANDFVNIDMAVKISELELFKHTNSPLIIYPKFEWHKSTDSTDLKNKLDAGVNFEFYPFPLNADNYKGVVMAPWFQGTSSFKRNLIDKVYETKLSLQVSFISLHKYYPGYKWRDKNKEARLIYYPYFGLEYNLLPDLLIKGTREEFSTYFMRIFVEVWIVPRTLQLNIDGTYRQIINNKSAIRTKLPIFNPSLYFYPGKQESIGIGFEYKNGYDTDSKFQLIQVSSLALNIKM